MCPNRSQRVTMTLTVIKLMMTLTLHTSSSWLLMSRHRCRVLPSSSSRRMYFPPSSEAVWPSRGWPRPGETGGGRQRETGHRGGERRGGGITVLWIDTSVRDWAASGAMGTWPGVAMVTAEGASRGFTREVRLESETEAGEEAGVSIMMTSGHSGLRQITGLASPWKTWSFTVFTFCYHTRKRNAVRTFTTSQRSLMQILKIKTCKMRIGKIPPAEKPAPCNKSDPNNTEGWNQLPPSWSLSQPFQPISGYLVILSDYSILSFALTQTIAHTPSTPALPVPDTSEVTLSIPWPRWYFWQQWPSLRLRSPAAGVWSPLAPPWVRIPVSRVLIVTGPGSTGQPRLRARPADHSWPPSDLPLPAGLTVSPGTQQPPTATHPGQPCHTSH